MKFHFSMINHNLIGQKTLYDMYYWISSGLRSLGHEISFNPNRLENNAINILWENFTPDMASAIEKSDLRFGLIATEIPTPLGFNNRVEQDWQLRWKGFHRIAHKAEFIWTTVPQAVQFYKRFAPTSFIEFGWDQHLVPDWINNNCEKYEFDFCFMGILNDFRKSILSNLEKHAKVFYSEELLDWDQMGEVIQRSKIGLGLKQNETWAIPSPTRIGRFLMAKRGLAHDWTPIRTAQSRFVQFNEDKKDFCDFALEMLERDWKTKSEVAFNRYRDELPMKNIMNEVLKNSNITEGVARTKKQFLKRLFFSGNKFEIPELEKTLLSYSNPPQLIEALLNYNIVKFQGKYFAIPHSLGPVDLLNGIGKIQGMISSDTYSNIKEKILNP